MMSKKIMDIHNKTPRTQNPGMNINMPVVEEFSAPQASYNIPQDVLTEVSHTSSPKKMTQEIPTEQRIMSSKLPDEIKRLMIEQPIVQPSSMGGSAAISDDIIEGAQRLMNINKNTSTQQPQSVKIPTTNQQQSSPYNFNMNEMKSMIRDVVRDTVRDVVREELKEAGMLVESTSNSNDTIQFKVGNHLFVGKVNKIKKLQ